MKRECVEGGSWQWYRCCLTAIVVSLTASGLLAAPPPGPSADSPQEKTWVYLSLAGPRRIDTYELNVSTGAMTRRQQHPLADEPGALTTDPKKRFLFASLRSSGRLTSFRRDTENGALELISNIPAAEDPAFVSTDRTGRFLLCAYYVAGKVSIHPIAKDGGIEAKSATWVTTASRAHAVLTDRSNRFVFVPHTKPNLIYQFRFDERAGTLAPNVPARVETEARTGPRHLFIHPTLDYVYFDNEQGNSVTVFRLDAGKGTLAPIQTLSTLPEGYDLPNSCARLEGAPSGRFLYAANRGHDSIAVFEIDTDSGKLVSRGQAKTEATPRSFTIEPGERYLIAAGQSSGRVAVFAIDPKRGTLDRRHTYEVGERPWWVMAVGGAAGSN